MLWTRLSILPNGALKSIANAIGVSIDALLNDDTITIKGKDFLKRFDVIENMTNENK